MVVDEEHKLSLKATSNSQIIAYEDGIVKLSRKNPYGFTSSIYDFYENEYFHISVWRYGDNDDGLLVADGMNDSRFYYVQNKPSLIDTNGWQLLTLDIHIPPHHNFNELRIYVWNSGKDIVYFRDLKIERLPQKAYPEFEQLALEIIADNNAIKKFEKIRDLAFKNNILETGDDDYVKVKLIYGSDTMKANIRLKGDLLDHLIGSKWSFRVKMRKEDSWKNMRTFSLQSPETRGFLDEWFAHKVFASEDVLTTRYGFVPVKLNGRSLGIYAYEEHFDKHLVESNKRREGPIIKFSEELFFTMHRIYYTEGKYYNVPFFEASDILPFKENRTLNNKILYDEFLVAQNLLYQFKNDLRPVSEIFDIKSLAKYYALTDIISAYHGFKWHNIRFYYNPVICRLEPVAFDCYPISGIKYGDNINSITEMFQKTKSLPGYDHMLILPLIQDDFRKEYISSLAKYSRENFLDSIYNSHVSELDSLAGLIKKEYGYFQFDYSQYRANSKKNIIIPDTHKKTSGKRGYGVPKVQEVNTDQELPDDFIPFLVKIFRNRYSSDSILYLNSFYPGEIKFIGYSDNDTVMKYKTETIDIPAETSNFPLRIINPDMAQYLFFKVRDRKKSFAIPVFRWDMPFDYSPFQELSERYKIENQTVLKQDGKNLIITGKLDISEPLIIPDGYIVIIKPGTELNFINKSTFVSYSPVYIKGTKAQPVRVTSTDGTAMGFNIFQSRGKSILENVVIDQLNTLDFNGWTLTGAVNFYESDVDMTNVTFKDNRCEDALNIIRSDFMMTDCTFDNIFADAFDSDFSNGSLINSVFRDIANDAIDFSGSRVTVRGCEIYNAGDKGISCGEKSEIMVENVRVNNANIAIASKDLSRLTISNSLISNSIYSFVAFKKKPEFGEAEIHSINTTIKNIMSGQIIELGSVIYINNNLISGTYKNVAERFNLK